MSYGAPGRTRTSNPLLRRQVLYPVELRAPKTSAVIAVALYASKKSKANLKIIRKIGVTDGARTHDNRSHSPGLYQLSYSHHRDFAINKKLVGVERFELPTSCSQSKRATRLRYTPIIQCAFQFGRSA